MSIPQLSGLHECMCSWCPISFFHPCATDSLTLPLNLYNGMTDCLVNHHLAIVYTFWTKDYTCIMTAYFNIPCNSHLVSAPWDLINCGNALSSLTFKSTLYFFLDLGGVSDCTTLNILAFRLGLVCKIWLQGCFIDARCKQNVQPSAQQRLLWSTDDNWSTCQCRDRS